jgi:hypothetical protein
MPIGVPHTATVYDLPRPGDRIEVDSKEYNVLRVVFKFSGQNGSPMNIHIHLVDL